MCLATFAVTYDVFQSSTKKEETDGVNEEEEMQNTGNDNPLTQLKQQKGLGVIRTRKQEAILAQEGTKFMQNQKNITIQTFFCVTHGIMRMTPYQHLQVIIHHT